MEEVDVSTELGEVVVCQDVDFGVVDCWVLAPAVEVIHAFDEELDEDVVSIDCFLEVVSRGLIYPVLIPPEGVSFGANGFQGRPGS